MKALIYFKQNNHLFHAINQRVSEVKRHSEAIYYGRETVMQISAFAAFYFRFLTPKPPIRTCPVIQKT